MRPSAISRQLPAWVASRLLPLSSIAAGRREMAFPFVRDHAVLEILLLPDGHDLLQPVDAVMASLKGRAAMLRSHDTRHAGLSYIDATEPVNDSDVVDREPLV